MPTHRPTRRRLSRRRLIAAGGIAALAAGAAMIATGAFGAARTVTWTVYHGNAAGSGSSNVLRSVTTSSRAWTSTGLDGKLYGQPIVLGGRVFVATENNRVYALSAATGRVVWSRRVAAPVPASALPCGNIGPTVGITGTPVIDPARHEIFVVADEYVHARPIHVLVGLDTGSGAVRMVHRVDPPGQSGAVGLQRTGLTLDAGQVVFGLGGNYGDCGQYRGRVVAVRETGGTPKYFTVDAAAGQRMGAIWMGGAAPAVDAHGRIWVGVGNGSATAGGQRFDHSDAVLELSSSLRLVQYFAPSSWRSDNASDLDLSMAPALLSNGKVVASGKSAHAYLLNAGRLGGIGHQQATASVCGGEVTGGAAVVGTTVYLPCLNGPVALRVSTKPVGLHVRWSAGAGGGPPIVAANRVWTVGQDGDRKSVV